MIVRDKQLLVVVGTLAACSRRDAPTRLRPDDMRASAAPPDMRLIDTETEDLPRNSPSVTDLKPLPCGTRGMSDTAAPRHECASFRGRETVPRG